jgi:hypothetical protein
MDTTRPLAWLVVAVLSGAIGALAVSLGTTNPLLTASEFTAPALVTLGVVAVTILGLIAVARSTGRPPRTPYW